MIIKIKSISLALIPPTEKDIILKEPDLVVSPGLAGYDVGHFPGAWAG